MIEKVIMQDHDPEMVEANRRARSNFKYFWRELSWERRRIIPGHEISAVKKPFATTVREPGVPPFEHMWIGDVDFDGERISGHLLNEPRWVAGVAKGERVELSLHEMSNWMFAVEGRVYGGFTMQMMRRHMPPEERRAHDEAWGLEFGDPRRVVVAMAAKSGAEGWAEGDRIPEHPASENMTEKIEEQLRTDPAPFLGADGEGFTMLHVEALAGNATPVRLLLKYGADRKTRDRRGRTPLDLARVMGWNVIVGLLSS